MAPVMKNTASFCFVSTEQEADEAKEVLDKANFAQRQQRGNFRLLLPPHLCTIGVYLPKARKQTHHLDQLLLFKNGLHLSTFIGAELYITSTIHYNLYRSL